MLIEGKGIRAPSPIRIDLTSADLALLREKAVQRDRFRQYARRRDAWGRGLTSDPIWRGLVGEHACWLYLLRAGLPCSPLEFALLRHGDGGRDLTCCGWTLQVKTRATNYGQLLVRRVYERRRLRGLSCDAFISAEWRHVGDPVLLLGWMRAIDFSGRARLRRSMKGSFWNLVVPDGLLQPMSDLRAELRYRMEVA